MKLRSVKKTEVNPLQAIIANYRKLISYLSDHLRVNQKEPSAQAIKEIFDDPEERGVIIQITGFGRNKIPDSEYATIANNVMELRKGTLFKGLTA